MSSGMPTIEARATPRRTPKPMMSSVITQTASMGQKTPETTSKDGDGSSATCR